MQISAQQKLVHTWRPIINLTTRYRLTGCFAVADDVIVVGRGEIDNAEMLHQNAN